MQRSETQRNPIKVQTQSERDESYQLSVFSDHIQSINIALNAPPHHVPSQASRTITRQASTPETEGLSVDVMRRLERKERVSIVNALLPKA